MTTEKLYWPEPQAAAFQATAARATIWAGRPAIVLDRTLFYPEGGGQLGDSGVLQVGTRRLRVADTQTDEHGVIHHLLEGDEQASDRMNELHDLLANHAASVSGEIDAARRRDHTAHHTAQHMLSRALLDVASAPTVSARLGQSACTIDVAVPRLDDADLVRAEDLVNGVVQGDVVIRQIFPTAEELAAMPLRRAPKVDAGVRVIDIEDFDLTPCGGTHCTRSGQVGQVRVSGVERYKGKMRVEFRAAGRAIHAARQGERVLGELAARMTCGALDVGRAVARLQTELKATEGALMAARTELAGRLADELLACSPALPQRATVITVDRPGDDVGMLRILVRRLAARPDVLALCTSRTTTGRAATGETILVVQRGADVIFDCGAWLKPAVAAIGGRGGGTAQAAEARVAADVGELANAIALPESVGRQNG